MTEGFKFFDKFIFKYEHYYASFYYTFCSQPYHINNGALFDALGVQIHIRVYETKGRRFLEDEFDTITANANKELKTLLLTPNNNTDRLISYVNSKLKDIKTNKDVIANVIDSVNLEILNNDKIIDKTIIDRELYDFVTNKILVFEDWFNKLNSPYTVSKSKRTNVEYNNDEKPIWFKVGLKFAIGVIPKTGESEFNSKSETGWAKHFFPELTSDNGNNSARPFVSGSKNFEITPKSNKNIFSSNEKVLAIHKHCLDKNIKMCESFLHFLEVHQLII